ncbi:DNLZ [Candida margitis]|uniref:DNLZ n=1 Tax=Candida margitis TaxID=1775924 RepID=UPI002226819C|nr:DNLZ [Candida margitis]KAI5958133.1 DNLZ [Candida margitis]
MLSRSIRTFARRIPKRQVPAIRSIVSVSRIRLQSVKSSVPTRVFAVNYSSATQPDANGKGELLIEFTCNVCDNRSSHNMSKQAYEHGTVLIQCPECKSRHLIADHLGFIRDEKFDLKDYIESQGSKIDSRVLEFEKIPSNLASSSGQTAEEDTPKQEKVLDLESPDDEVIKNKKI